MSFCTWMTPPDTKDFTKNCYKNKKLLYTMFHEMCDHAHACTSIHTSKFTCAIDCMGEIIIFSLFFPVIITYFL